MRSQTLAAKIATRSKEVGEYLDVVENAQSMIARRQAEIQEYTKQNKEVEDELSKIYASLAESLAKLQV